MDVSCFPLSILIDTGAEVFLLSDGSFKRIDRSGRIRLSKPPHTLVHYLKSSIPVLGCFCTNIVFNDSFGTIKFYVVRNGHSLLRVDVVHDLRMISSGVPLLSWHVNSVSVRVIPPRMYSERNVQVFITDR